MSGFFSAEWPSHRVKEAEFQFLNQKGDFSFMQNIGPVTRCDNVYSNVIFS